MPLISLREFARRNGVSDRAIGKAVKAGRLPHVDGKIDPAEAQPVWDRIKDPIRAGRRLRDPGDRGPSSQGTDSGGCELGCELSSQGTETPVAAEVRTQVRTPVEVESPTPASGCELEVRTPIAEVRTQVRTPDSGPPAMAGLNPPWVPGPPQSIGANGLVPGRPYYTPPPTNGREQVPITIALNGSEELELEKGRTGTGLSLPSYVITAIGYEQWRLEAARDCPEPPSRRRPVRHGLERRSVTIVVSRNVFEDLWYRAEGTGWPMPQFIRKLLGFRPRWSSNPKSFDRYEEEDEAWERLLRLGLEPKAYFYFPDG